MLCDPMGAEKSKGSCKGKGGRRRGWAGGLLRGRAPSQRTRRFYQGCPVGGEPSTGREDGRGWPVCFGGAELEVGTPGCTGITRAWAARTPSPSHGALPHAPIPRSPLGRPSSLVQGCLCLGLPGGGSPARNSPLGEPTTSRYQAEKEAVILLQR